MHYVYVIECRTPNTFYVGMTASPLRRIWQHTVGRGSMWTRQHGVNEVILIEACKSKSAAEARETALTLQYAAAGHKVRGAAWTGLAPPEGPTKGKTPKRPVEKEKLLFRSPNV